MKDFAEQELYKDSSWFTTLLLRENDSLYSDAALSQRFNPQGITPRLWTSAVTFLIMMLVGIGIGSVAQLVQVTRPAVQVQTESLRNQVITLQGRVDAASNRNQKLKSDIEQLREYVLPTDNDLLNQSFAQAAAIGGFSSMVGRGVQIQLETNSSASGADLVLDVDLIATLNGLWEAGAEAVAINGHRITATTAIRNAGSAVLVDFEPLQNPVVISAIGPNNLFGNFLQTDGYFWLQDLKQNYPIAVTYSKEKKIALDADTIPTLEFSERISE